MRQSRQHDLFARFFNLTRKEHLIKDRIDLYYPSVVRFSSQPIDDALPFPISSFRSFPTKRTL